MSVSKKRRGEKRNKLYYFKAAILKWYEGKKVTFIFRDIFRTLKAFIKPFEAPSRSVKIKI